MPDTIVAGEKTLKQYVAQIERAQGSFIVIGEALSAIRDRALYESAGDGETKFTFESWCQENFEFSRQRAYQLMSGARIAKTADQVGTKLNEGQARELAGLENDPEAIEDLLARAKEASPNGKLTAALIRSVRVKLAGPNAQEKPEAPVPGNSAADPDGGEDWDAVLKRTKREVTKMTGYLPPSHLASWAETLEANARKARRLAMAASRD